MKNSAPYISVVVPLYNEVENAIRLWEAIVTSVKSMDKTYEIILVDDGSTDGTRDVLRQIAQENKHVKIILFRANFGQSAAMAAGFKATRGDVVVALDGDLQNDPKDIPRLVEKLEQGFDVVSGWRKNRQDKLIARKIPSRIANKIICSVTDVQLHDTGCSLKAFRGEMLRKISLYGEMHRFIPALFRMHGAKIAEMPVTHHPRLFGTSKYNISRTFRVIMDLTTIRLLMRHLDNPSAYFGIFSGICLLTGFASLAGILYFLIILNSEMADVNILVTMAVLLFATSVQFLFFGLIGKLIVFSGNKSLNKS